MDRPDVSQSSVQAPPGFLDAPLTATQAISRAGAVLALTDRAI
jgi:hypothetical protein